MIGVKDRHQDCRTFDQIDITRLAKADRHRYMQIIKNWSVDFIVTKRDIWMPFNQFQWVFSYIPSELDINYILPSNILHIFLSIYQHIIIFSLILNFFFIFFIPIGFPTLQKNSSRSFLCTTSG